jgi:glutamyl-tRNA reductase
MGFLLVGFSHNNCPLDIMEKIHITPKELSGFYNGLPFKSKFYLQTCNRRELIVDSDNPVEAGNIIKDIISERFKLSPKETEIHSRMYMGKQAVKHLFGVATGLKSAVTGEKQILSQMRTSYNEAKSIGALRGSLDGVIQWALFTGKKAHRIMPDSRYPESIAETALDFAVKHHGLLSKRIMLIGAGETIYRIATGIKNINSGLVFVANRNIDKARELARKTDSKAIPLSDIGRVINEVDIIFSATSAPHYILRKELLAKIDSPVTIFDLAIPRDIESTENPLIKVMDISALKKYFSLNYGNRLYEYKKLKKIVDLEVSRWNYDYQVRNTKKRFGVKTNGRGNPDFEGSSCLGEV